MSDINCRNCMPGVNCRNRWRQPREVEDVQEADTSDGSQVGREGEEREGSVNEEQEQQSAGVAQDNRFGHGQEKRFWEDKTAEEVEEVTENIYKKIVAFSPNNIFEMPSGNAAKKRIREMAFLIREYTRESNLSTNALKILAILPHLLCQRTHEKSRTVEDRKALERRMVMWEKGEVQSLVKKTETLQKE